MSEISKGTQKYVTLLSSIRDGSESAFHTLLCTYGDNLIRYSARLTGDIDTAQDIVQEVFLYLWQDRKRIKSDWDISAYLFGHTRNRSINAAKSRQAEVEREAKWSDQLRIDTETTPGLDSLLGEEEKRIRSDIWNALSRVSPRCREVFMLVWDHQLPYREISTIVGLSEPTVRNYMSKAIRHLSEMLGPKIRQGSQ